MPRNSQGGRRRRRKLRKSAVAVLIALVALICVVMVLFFNQCSNKIDTVSSSEQQSSSDVFVLSSSTISSSSSALESASKPVSSSSSVKSSTQSSKAAITSSSKVDVLDDGVWNLKLVNSENALDDSFSIKTAVINSKYAKTSGMKFDARAIGALEKMCQAALDDNVKLIIISSYRTTSVQRSLYNAEVQEQLALGYDTETAKKMAAREVAYPGTSEHNLGLAVDFNSVEQTFENTKQYRWLRENAENYGFIMRYPEDKQNITNVIYEPWHYRYVGVEHAKKINSLGLSFEEYVEYLKNN